MNENRMSTARSANEACPRPAESGETHCGACGLEGSLYRRDSRREGQARPERSPRGAGRAIGSVTAP
ncbi:MAG: hypothetical protein WEB59_16150 [Thermoanaerobaculia bacterium]